MALALPSRDTIFAAFIGDYAVAQPDKNTSRGSDPYRLGRVVSGACWAVLSKLQYFDKQRLPDTATGAFLDRWGTVYQFPRLLPAGSSGQSVLEVTGTPATPVPFGTQLSHADGTLYQVSSAGAVIGVGGSVVVSVQAISTGLATNKVTDDTLTFTSAPAGIDPDATLVAPLTGGIDIETDDAYRVRLLAHIGDPPEGGAIHDYLEWATSIPGVATGYVWAHRRGLGTIDVAVLGGGTGSARVASATVIDAVDDYIESVRPGNVRDFLVLITTPTTQNVIMTVDAVDGYNWDWDDLNTGYAITAFNASAQTITVPSALGTVVAGVRLTVRGEEASVVSNVGNVLTLSFANDHDNNPVSWFTFAITTGTDVIRASGDLVRPIRDAVMDLFNALGPARSIYSQTTWTSSLKLSKLFGAITDVPGCDDAEVSTPTGNVDLVDAYGTSVPFLVPGIIQVLKPAS